MSKTNFAVGFGAQLARHRLTEETFRLAMGKRGTPKGFYQVKSWLDGDRTPPLDVFNDLCDFFDCTGDELSGRVLRAESVAPAP